MAFGLRGLSNLPLMGLTDGWRVPGYTEVRELGGGSRGRAVLVRHHRSAKDYVIKYLTSADPAARHRFAAESALLQQVFSPYVARWYGHLDEGPVSAILMEAVDGVSLEDILDRSGGLAPEAALTVFKGSLLGLQEAHSRGVVHRGHQPESVVVRKDGRSKIIGFGVAVLAGEHSGSPAYLAPEQWPGEPAVPASDVYAATCVFAACLTGGSPSAVPPEALLPDELHELLVAGLAKAPQDRPPTAASFAAALEIRAAAVYGADWERRGLDLLGGLAADLGTLLPR